MASDTGLMTINNAWVTCPLSPCQESDILTHKSLLFLEMSGISVIGIINYPQIQSPPNTQRMIASFIEKSLNQHLDWEIVVKLRVNVKRQTSNVKTRP